MDYSAEVRRRFAAALARPDPAGDGSTTEFIGAAEDRTLGIWARARVSVSRGRITAAAFDIYGCPDTIAAAQSVAERLCGTAVADFAGLDARRLADSLGIPAEKLGKVLRLEDAVIAAIAAARAHEQLAQGRKEGNDGDITD
jgi:NifU-like protein involved in Fe-S cluster formation